MVVHQIGHQPPTAQAVYAVFLPAAVVIAIIACVISPITAHNTEAFAKRHQGFDGSRVSNRKNIHCTTTRLYPFSLAFSDNSVIRERVYVLVSVLMSLLFMGSLIGGRIAPPCRSCCHTRMHVASASLTFSSCFLEYIHPARLSPL